MFTLTRRRVRLLRAAVRRSDSIGRPRGPDPAVCFVAGREGRFVFAPSGEVTVGLRLSESPAPTEAFSVPLSLLGACEGADNSPVSFELNGEAVKIAWADRGLTRCETVLVPKVVNPALPDLPESFANVGRSFPEAMHEAGRCAAKESHRHALTRIQIRGGEGKVIGSDAKQALVVGGFHPGFAGDLLVPAVPVFGLKELAAESPVRAGRTADGLCVGLGDWFVWLTEEMEGSFPDVAAVIRRNQGGTRIRIGPNDAARLLAGLPKLPGADEEFSPVTLEAGRFPVVRAGNPDRSDVVELGLADSDSDGPPVSWAMDRRYLHRALLLGFRDFSARKSSQAAVAIRGDNVFLFALLNPESAVLVSPAARRAPPDPAAGLIPTTSLMPRSSDMRPPDPIPRPEPSPGDDSVDPLAEAEALRAMLHEAVTRSVRLVGFLKHHRRQRKALESAWASLQQLKLGTGG